MCWIAFSNYNFSQNPALQIKRANIDKKLKLEMFIDIVAKLSMALGGSTIYMIQFIYCNVTIFCCRLQICHAILCYKCDYLFSVI